MIGCPAQLEKNGANITTSKLKSRLMSYAYCLRRPFLLLRYVHSIHQQCSVAPTENTRRTYLRPGCFSFNSQGKCAGP